MPLQQPTDPLSTTDPNPVTTLGTSIPDPNNLSSADDEFKLMKSASFSSDTSFKTVSDTNAYIDGTGDFNRDGNPDLIWRNYETGDNTVWLMDGTQVISTVSLAPVLDINWRIAGTSDFNRDGNPDLIWRNYTTGDNKVWLMDGIQLLSEVSLDASPDKNWYIEGISDFNRDDNPDLVWRNYKTGENSIWFMDGAEILDIVSFEQALNTDWHISGVGDFNRDGNSDLIWRNYRTGENAFWLMNDIQPSSTSISFNAAEPVRFDPWSDTNWHLIVADSFNGDGDLNLVWRNYRTGENMIWADLQPSQSKAETPLTSFNQINTSSSVQAASNNSDLFVSESELAYILAQLHPGVSTFEWIDISNLSAFELTDLYNPSSSNILDWKQFNPPNPSFTYSVSSDYNLLFQPDFTWNEPEFLSGFGNSDFDWDDNLSFNDHTDDDFVFGFSNSSNLFGQTSYSFSNNSDDDWLYSN